MTAARQPASEAEAAHHSRPVAEILRSFSTSLDQGLSPGQVASQRARYGKNELTAQQRASNLARVIAQLRSGLVLLLVVAALVSLALWVIERTTPYPNEALVIGCVVILNTLVGVAQESRADRALAVLRRLHSGQVEAVRAGARCKLDIDELVPGDVIFLREGDRVPADARLLRCSALFASEAALTGESASVVKSVGDLPSDTELIGRTNMLYAGTTVAAGSGTSVVVATGMATELGRITRAVAQAKAPPTPLQTELDRLGKRLALGVGALAAIMVAVLSGVRDFRGWHAAGEALILGIALAVAAVPEGLSAVVTAALAVGVRRMAGRNVIVRRLAAVEVLGSASVIASDKTGTLTRNEMTVRVVASASGRVEFDSGANERSGGPDVGDERGLHEELVSALTAAACANDATLEQVGVGWHALGDPTEGALLLAAREHGLERGALATRYPRIAEAPFSAERRRMSTLHHDLALGEFVTFTKGAGDAVLPLCSTELRAGEAIPLDAARRASLSALGDALAGEGLRVLALALGRRGSSPVALTEDAAAELETDLTFVAWIGLIDPPRPEARAAVKQARAAGIRPIMITGDHPSTARAVAKELALADDVEVLQGRDLDALDDASLTRALAAVSVYARVAPAHKLRLVRLLQRQGEVVAMTGDGVNDAPALKAADIGIAMGRVGSDASKEAADMVLVDDNFASIVAAVEEGRAIFSNIRKFLRYLLATNIGEVLVMFMGVLLAAPLGLPVDGSSVSLPISAAQLLWINLVTDGLPALALGLDPAHPDAMSRPPRGRAEPIVDRETWRTIARNGAVVAASTLLMLDAALPGGFIAGDQDFVRAQSTAFTTLVLCSMWAVFTSRSNTRSALREVRANRWLWWAVLVSLGLHVSVLSLPLLQRAFGTARLGWRDWTMALLASSSVFVSSELAKYWRRCKQALR